MAAGGIPRQGIDFLRELSNNNNKAWFDAHRNVYESGLLEPAKRLVADLGEQVRVFAPNIHAEPSVARGSIARINRDIRFTKDKSPYKDHLDVFLWEGGGSSMSGCGFFVRITPELVRIGAGKHDFEPNVLEAYRRMVVEPETGQALEQALRYIEAAGYELGGKGYKQVPRGYDPNHPRARLLLHNALVAGTHTRHPPELSTPGFAGWCSAHFHKLLPLHTWLVDLLAWASD